MGQERKIIDNEFSDMEEIDTEKSLKHDYKEKNRDRGTSRRKTKKK